MRNTITKEMVNALALTTNYQIVDYPSNFSGVIANGGQAVLTFKRTNGTSITFKIDEYFGENTGWVQKTEDDGTNLTLIERTSTESAFSYAFPTLAEKIRVHIKGAGGETAQVLLSVGEIS